MGSEAIAGFVLAGGHSSRMGRDKALLPWKGGTLLDHVAETVEAAVGNVTVVGRTSTRFPCLLDDLPEHGPLGGLATVLGCHPGWILLVACDMPNLTPDLIEGLADTARQSLADAVVCEAGGRLHPLCAAYHHRLLPAAEAAVRNNSLKMHDFLSTIRVQRWAVAEPDLLANVNTPEQFKEWKP